MTDHSHLTTRIDLASETSCLKESTMNYSVQYNNHVYMKNNIINFPLS
jgi:hypothetical protein